MIRWSPAWSLVLLCVSAGGTPAAARPPQSVPPAPAAGHPAAPQAGQGTRHIYISAIDKKGEPVAGLTAKDLTVREDGVKRDVLNVQAATAPLTIALLVDDTGPGIRFIREGVGMFMHRLGGLAEIALISTGGRNTTIVDFTRRLDELYQGVRQLSTRTTTGAYLLDGVHDAIGALNDRESERPVIVVLTLEGPEFSNLRADRLIGELLRSGATMHVVALGKPTLKTMTSWNEMPASRCARTSTRTSTGRSSSKTDRGSRADGTSRCWPTRGFRRR